jgi:glycosyltransferase involved in cell wall biosynthesis
VSDFTLSWLQVTFGLAQHGKSARIYPFVSVDSTHMKEPALPGLRAHPFILTVAQHRRNKNLPLLLSAFADLKRRHGHRELKLVLVGGHGPETASLRRLTRELRIDDSVVFTRGLIDVELCWLYKHCALFVAPSSIEGFGHPVCEALQCGSHVLCSDIPAFREIGGAACHYFDVLSASPTRVLSDAMAEALAQPRPVVRRENPFSSERTAAQHVSLYSALTSFPPKAALENIHHALIRNDALQSRAAS